MTLEFAEKHYFERSSRFAGCAPAFGRVELFIFKELNGTAEAVP
jgi:hypothetical protein